MNVSTRREFLQRLGISSAAMPFLMGLPSLGEAAPTRPRQRLIVMFSPNGTIPKHYWPDQRGADFALKPILKPLEPFRDQLLVLKGVHNSVRGDGDSHMRGMSCLLTGIELFPGNIQGGSHTPAGWAKGISIDQEIKNFLQSQAATRTRFGALEFGVGVSDRADPWTRMSYAGPNQPVAPTDDPYLMYQKLYGNLRDKAALQSVLGTLQEDFKKLGDRLSPADRALLEQNAKFVSELDRELAVIERELSILDENGDGDDGEEHTEHYLPGDVNVQHDDGGAQIAEGAPADEEAATANGRLLLRLLLL